MAKLRINIKYNLEKTDNNAEVNKNDWFIWGGATEVFYPFIKYNEDNSIEADTNQSSYAMEPFKLSEPVDGYDESYELILPPQTLPIGKILVTFRSVTFNGDTYLRVPEGVILTAGKVFSLNYTINGRTVKVTTDESINWNAGTSGSGSVELP